MSDLAVATTIRDQIGHKALFMLGAQNLLASENALSFKIRGSKAYSHIRIELNGLDLYDVTFLKYRNFDKVAEKKVENIYNDMLHDVIERNTGLYTRLI